MATTVASQMRCVVAASRTVTLRDETAMRVQMTGSLGSVTVAQPPRVRGNRAAARNVFLLLSRTSGGIVTIGDGFRVQGPGRVGWAGSCAIAGEMAREGGRASQNCDAVGRGQRG